MEVELKRLEDLSDAIVQDFADMKKREEDMRNTNGEPFPILLDLDHMQVIVNQYF